MAMALVLTLAVVAPAAANMKILEPHDPSWERIFKISWQTDEKKGRPVVEGYVVNDSPYATRWSRSAGATSGCPRRHPAPGTRCESIRSTGSKGRLGVGSPEPSGEAEPDAVDIM
jgi:hypothetical protein